ncbi:MAG TPA: tRNA (adenosine(37)-N6)-dimethylallyltransferase MiaA [Candidatus Saccharimonadales bacterium]|nr:tRNA (adenosine(37)-N6)-dimethylallyltransferase MiaA [Candidatus Saccharimonadales bacterium]
MATTRKQPLIVIVGETASGKTELASKLAKKLNGEVIAADSWTVYKDFDIATAKPSTKERRSVRYHMVDIVEPDGGFSAAEFKKLADLAIRDIQERGKLPIVVGGSGLYIDSLIYDYSFLPAPRKGLREELNKMSLSELQQLADSAGYDTLGIDLKNKRRITRLIENKGAKPKAGGARPDTLIIGLGLSRDDLDLRISKRLDQMLETGLEDEVRLLAERWGWDVEPMKGIGYREFREYFLGTKNLDETKQKISKNTRDLAKKQRTWFAHNKSIQWAINTEQAVAIATTFVNKYSD